ncbi:MAG: DUF2934 domain-containing protein [Planctomycetes bacterium]|nr:DUF2934 domain-containing protein [Planctomycetota bacterium]
MASKTPKNTVATSTTRTGGATTTLRPVGAQAPTATKTTPKPTREQIAQRAHEIWVKNGCKHGQDEQNWLEAERQLKAEMSR